MRDQSYEPLRILGPGERFDSETGTVLYSAAWLNRPSAVPDSTPYLYDVRIGVYPVERDEPVGLALSVELRVEARDERRAIEEAAGRLLSR